MSSTALCLQQCRWIAQGFFACDKQLCFPWGQEAGGIYWNAVCSSLAKLVDEVQALFYGHRDHVAVHVHGGSVCPGPHMTSGGEILKPLVMYNTGILSPVLGSSHSSCAMDSWMLVCSGVI